MFKRLSNILLTNEKGDACCINLLSFFSLPPIDESACASSPLFLIF